ncbi:stage V sporulation protein B [Firmicutes bacterium CAG:460]|jgi:stage V sporulation protein B|uniref:oligosaccharide flippase family protein n=1 Tax=Candidatus Onthocola sp. TaxID=3085646 RepID=UPI0003356EC1|nr:oligosaccharide flippase family protein [Bacillota bacterium]CDE50997.1 stage V sporulation protein B [Firmicutes bacterium CAG:460]
MKKNLFIKSTLILILSGFLTKMLGFIIKVVYTRIIGEYGISLFTIATPTYSLLLTISTLAIPISISKLVSENKGRSIRILTSATFLILSINFLLILIIFLTKDFIATNLLKEPLASPILMAFALTLPFVSISAVLKGYFAGKQNMVPHATSNILEQIVRLIIIVTILPILMKKSVMYAVLGLILLTILSEISSIIVFLFFLPKHINYKTNLLPSKKHTKDILNISLPTVSSRIIGNIGYFLEPIILTNLLLFSGYTNAYILREYGAYNAYSLALLTMPGFFIAAISTSLLPEISKFHGERNSSMVKRRIKQSLLFALLIGTFFSFIIFTFRDKLLFTLYNTTNGSDYIKILAPFFVLFYLEGVLTSALQALGHAKITMNITLWGVILKLLVMAILSLCHIGIYSLVIAEIINILFVVLINFKYLKIYV